MALKKLPYKNINELIQKNLPDEDDQHTVNLSRLLQPSRRRGWLTKTELEMICRWKSPRAIRLIQSNHAATIRKVTKAAFQVKDETEKMRLLTLLKGVSIPMASAVLTLLYPKRYGVIDIRVWQILHQMKIVETNKRGTAFRVAEWVELLVLLRKLSKQFGQSVRLIEYSIFLAHQRHQVGTLYQTLKND
ncbi:hypothetical protein [Lacibacter sediminis]|uniref:Uncharacterized protein n=1 Tax=Lacibacter sediminis TaxID=2760713 RepID=A0A7G5XLW6_9BACT|nr:hypothetical protein [Lacibacter sediminis]QNA46469.1 hypothetical protein H4075_09945 [Lacibacter sediminis]